MREIRQLFIDIDRQLEEAARAKQQLDADTADDRTKLLRATAQELGPTRDAVLETAVQRLDLSQKQAAEAYTLA